MTTPPPAPPPGWPDQGPPGDWSAPGWAPPRRNGPAIWSLILGLVALPAVLFIWPGFLIAVVALALGVIARGRVRRGESDAPGRATAGTVLGATALVASVVWGAIVFFADQRNQDRYEDCLLSGQAAQVCVERYDPSDP